MGTGEVRPDREDVLARARRGDRDAFGRLVKDHESEVFTLALRLTGDRELAADIAQEAFVRAWRALPRFRGDAQFSTWLHRIVVNTAWSQRRTVRRHHAEPLDGLTVPPRATGLSPERAAESADLRSRLLVALDGLSPRTRTVVVLKDVYDWSHKEIGEHLEITVTAAKVRLHRGRKRLRELLWAEAGAER